MFFNTAALSMALMATSALASPLHIARKAYSGKAGLGVERWEGESTKMFSNAAKFTWGYNWNADLDRSYLPNQEYVPMCWGENLSIPGRSWQDCKDGLQKTFSRNPGTKHILGFNEPDIGSQANMDVPTAVSKWREIMEPYGAQGVRLGSPGITSIQGDPNAGLPWLKSFLTQCTGCKVDFIAIHYYDHEGNVQRFIDYLSYVRDQLVTMGVDKPIWVTEVGVLPGQAAAADPNVHLSFMKGVCDFMDSQSYVERYAYFGTVPGPTIESKMVENGQLNAIGQAYNA